MKTDEIEIGVQAKLTVDRGTVEACLKLVELYVNRTQKNIIVYKSRTGEIVLEFEAGTEA